MNRFLLSLISLSSAHFICRSNFFSKNSTDNNKHVDHSVFWVSTQHSFSSSMENGEFIAILMKIVLKRNAESKYLNDWNKMLLLITLYPPSTLPPSMLFWLRKLSSSLHHFKTSMNVIEKLRSGGHLGARGGNDK